MKLDPGGAAENAESESVGGGRRKLAVFRRKGGSWDASGPNQRRAAPRFRWHGGLTWV